MSATPRTPMDAALDEGLAPRYPAGKPAETPPTWAIVHLMGHARYAGRLSEEEKFSVKLGRVDVPQDDGSFVTVYFGGGSVYKIEVVSEAAARIASRIHAPQPVSPWDFPKQLPAAGASLPPDYIPIAEDDEHDIDDLNFDLGVSG